MSYRKVGGLHFVRIGRFGFSWFVARRRQRGQEDGRALYKEYMAYDAQRVPFDPEPKLRQLARMDASTGSAEAAQADGYVYSSKEWGI
jgi:hypothetical protein